MDCPHYLLMYKITCLSYRVIWRRYRVSSFRKIHPSKKKGEILEKKISCQLSTLQDCLAIVYFFMLNERIISIFFLFFTQIGPRSYRRFRKTMWKWKSKIYSHNSEYWWSSCSCRIEEYYRVTRISIWDAMFIMWRDQNKQR